MIELEIQALSLNRDGLLIEVGRVVTEQGFTLQRQRLAQDPHGVLLTMVVRGAPRRQRKLEAALEALERLVSFQLAPFVDGQDRPHFAASRPVASAPAPAIPTAPPAPAATSPSPAAAPVAVVAATVSTPAAPPAEPEVPLWEELAALAGNPPLARPGSSTPTAPPSPTTVASASDAAPRAEIVPLGPDTGAVESVLARWPDAYPQILPLLRTLDRTVDAAARESSLAAAGRRAGTWLYDRDHSGATGLSLDDAIGRIAVPALQALAEVEPQGDQLRIRNSPLCTEDGHSGCQFFAGYLEGLLGAATASGQLSVFPVCCRSFGADECVLALSD